MGEATLRHGEEIAITATSVTLQNMSQDREAACNISGDGIGQNVQLGGGQHTVVQLGGGEVIIHNTGKPDIKVTW